MAAYLSDETLLELNDSIYTALNAYLNDAQSREEEKAIEIRFALPEPEETISEPSVSVFLYDIQEDLQLRHNEVRAFDSASGKLMPGYVHVRCCYLITYWGADDGSSASDIGPRSQSMRVMNKVMNALINSRSLSITDADDGKKSAYTRIIPPAEHLNSLGNFWQSLGNKPRLSLSYAVTVPVRLRDKNDVRTKIEETQAVMVQKS